MHKKEINHLCEGAGDHFRILRVKMKAILGEIEGNLNGFCLIKGKGKKHRRVRGSAKATGLLFYLFFFSF